MIKKKIKLISLTILAFILFVTSCQMNLPVDVSSGKDTDEPVIGFGTTENVDYIEGRLVVGYENKEAALEIVKMFDGTVLKDLEKIKALSFKFDGKVEDALNTLRTMKLEGIRYIEPSYIRQIEPPHPSDDNIVKSILNLPGEKQISEEYWNYLWGLKAINAELAWTTATGSGVVVAVIDTGVDGTHPDLQGQLVEGYRPLTVETLPATSDSSFGGAHGTHVAGTIAAKRDGNGVIGLAYNAKIMPIVIFDTSGYVGDDFVADGVIWAVDNGADVLSNSWGGWGYSYVLKDAYDYAIENGAIVVFSAGNGHTDQHVQAPVGYPGIIGVAAVEYNGGNYRTTFFSNRGDYVSVGAPGVAILSTVPLWDTDEFFDGQHPYAFYQGTSMACPHVSALAALIKEMYPNATQWEVRKTLEQSAIDIDDPGYDHNSGYGLINAQSALSLSPADVANMGANLDVVAVDSWGYSLQGVFVALHRKSGNGSNYYAKTDLSGVAHFPGVDTSEYDIIVGGPDSLDGSHYYGGYAGISYVYRQEEERQYTRTINLTANSTETFYFESTFMVDLVSSPTINATVSLNDSIYELMTGLRGSYASLSFTGNNSYDFSPIAGYCYLAITRDSTGATVTINGTATVNGYQIPIFGQLDKDATIAIIDDTGGAYGISLWWSLFGQSF